MTGAEFGGVDIDLLADYIGGALAGTPDESAVAARIADDPAWHTAYASLSAGIEQVGVALTRLPAEPMPADLATRLDTLFRSADPTASARSETPTASARSETPSSEASPDTDATGDAARITDSAPIPADLGAPPAPHLALVRGDAAVEDGRTPVREKTARRTGRRLRFATPIAIAAGLVAFVGFGLDFLAGHHSGSASDSTNTNAGLPELDKGTVPLSGPRIIASGFDYTIGTLATETQPFAASRSAPTTRKGTPDQVSSVGDPALERLASGSALQQCLARIERENAAGTISVRSVDYARFDGSPAVVVRFVATNGEWAWASGPLCGTPGGDADTLGKVPVR